MVPTKIIEVKPAKEYLLTKQFEPHFTIILIIYAFLHLLYP